MINLFYMDHLYVADSTFAKIVGSVSLPDAGVIRFGGSHPQCRYSSVHKAFKVVYLSLSLNASQLPHQQWYHLVDP